MNRRQLFTRLTAIALAPLAKWLPTPEPQWFVGTVTQVTRFGRPLTAAQLAAYYDLPELESIITFDKPSLPVPQEEA